MDGILGSSVGASCLDRLRPGELGISKVERLSRTRLQTNVKCSLPTVFKSPRYNHQTVHNGRISAGQRLLYHRSGVHGMCMMVSGYTVKKTMIFEAVIVLNMTTLSAFTILKMPSVGIY